jgi:hypothetical protein
MYRSNGNHVNSSDWLLCSNRMFVNWISSYSYSVKRYSYSMAVRTPAMPTLDRACRCGFGMMRWLAIPDDDEYEYRSSARADSLSTSTMGLRQPAGQNEFLCSLTVFHALDSIRYERAVAMAVRILGRPLLTRRAWERDLTMLGCSRHPRASADHFYTQGDQGSERAKGSNGCCMLQGKQIVAQAIWRRVAMSGMSQRDGWHRCNQQKSKHFSYQHGRHRSY